MQNQQTSERSLRSRLFITISCIASVCVLVWTLSLPFRVSVVSLSPTERAVDAETKQALDIVDQIKQRNKNSEMYRDHARYLDEQLMSSLAEKRQREQSKPGLEEARKYRKAYRDRIADEIKQLGQPRERSPQWYYQKYLEEKLASDDDAPI